ncbi:MAG: hypothetical protein K6G58_02585 [Lachnospiraceae bacterium]|nr:hypothetical protein [Lachnospiraceae bacterium]
MDNKNHTRARILTLIPIIVFAVTSAILVPMTISYLSTGSDVTAVAIIIVGTACLAITTLPCIVMSVLGTVYAAKAKKEGNEASRKFFVIGIVEIAVYSLGMICTAAAVFITVLAAAG